MRMTLIEMEIMAALVVYDRIRPVVAKRQRFAGCQAARFAQANAGVA